MPVDRVERQGSRGPNLKLPSGHNLTHISEGVLWDSWPDTEYVEVETEDRVTRKDRGSPISRLFRSHMSWHPESVHGGGESTSGRSKDDTTDVRVSSVSHGNTGYRRLSPTDRNGGPLRPNGHTRDQLFADKVNERGAVRRSFLVGNSTYFTVWFIEPVLRSLVPTTRHVSSTIFWDYLYVETLLFYSLFCKQSSRSTPK